MVATDQGTVPPQTPEKGEPDSPLDLPAQGWKAALKRAMKQFKEDRGSLVAAGMAFYWFLAIFPALLAAVGITALFNLSQDAIASITRAVQSALPGDAARVLTDALAQSSGRTGGSSAAAALIGIVLALWAASAGMAATQDGLNIVYEAPSDRPYLKKRIRALVLIAMAAVLGGIATAAIVFGAPIGDGIRDHLPLGGGIAFTLVWTIARWAVGLAALATLFAGFYYFAPNRDEPRWTWISPGGIVATVIWLLGSLGFSLYVNNLGSYAKTYGSFTGVVVLMLWLYLSGIALILGGEVNAELERQGEKQRRTQRSWGRRSAASPVAKAGRNEPVPANGAAEAPSTGTVNQAEQQWLEMMRRRY